MASTMGGRVRSTEPPALEGVKVEEGEEEE